MRNLAVVVALICMVELTAVAQDPSPPRAAQQGTGQQLYFNVLIADLPADSQVNALEPDALAEKIVAWDRQGELRSVTRIPLATLDQMPATIQFGKRVAVESGRTSPGGGRGPMVAYSIQSGGTLLQLTPALQENGTILVELTVEQSRIPEETGNEEEGAASPNLKASTMTAKTTLRIQPGKPVFVGGQKTVNGQDTTQTWIVLTASVGKEPK
jgi:hypothetical protein